MKVSQLFVAGGFALAMSFGIGCGSSICDVGNGFADDCPKLADKDAPDCKDDDYKDCTSDDVDALQKSADCIKDADCGEDATKVAKCDLPDLSKKCAEDFAKASE